MKTEEITIDGKKEQLVVDLDDDYMDDSILYDNPLEDTMELSNDTLKAIEDTLEINTGDIHEQDARNQ